MQKLYVIFFILASAMGNIAILSAEDFKIKIYRQWSGNRCTSGYLAVNGQIICYTLERPWKDNSKNISSIPAGIYIGLLRYDKNDHWRIQLEDIPERSGIQIHIGNQPDNTKGCILVGNKIGLDLCSLINSVLSYTKLKNAFYGSENPNSTPDLNVTVEIAEH